MNKEMIDRIVERTLKIYEESAGHINYYDPSDEELEKMVWVAINEERIENPESAQDLKEMGVKDKDGKLSHNDFVLSKEI